MKLYQIRYRPNITAFYWRVNVSNREHLGLKSFDNLEMNQRILRSSQLDALELDGELDFLFREYISDMFSFFRTPLKTKFEPEINLILDLIVYGSVLTTGKSYGLFLQNLIYKHKVDGGFRPITIKQKVGFLLSRILTKWGWNRLGKYMTSKQWSETDHSSWKYRLWKFIQRLEQTIKALRLANFLVFLYNGEFRSLTDRLLGMRLIYEKTEMSRMISFEYMNRQLVWYDLLPEQET
ncbi:peroxisome assembly protein (Peroxin-2) [Boothiomyces sp. JEL0866]|nr:peroxisome assembly protein (Peroxin-2) [Boothiomyces sp. JEL0866]